MRDFLKKFRAGFRTEPPVQRQTPRTFKPGPRDARVKRPDVFEPALLQYQRAFRPGEPQFADPLLARPWRDARRRVMDHVLCSISASPWGEHLVLRGSLLLKAWLGDAARDPGDIDFTVIPHTKLISEPWAAELFAGLVEVVRDQPLVGRGIEIVPHEVATDEIWTYDRAPGKRVVFPWKAEGLPGGVVQCDVVFGERIDPPPTRTLITAGSLGGGECTVWAATREQSLAWKILWLETDRYAQGKDLYDAALLAEQTTLPKSLLERTLLAEPGHRMTAPIDAELPLTWTIDWDNFKLEYPHVEGESRDWQERLAAALRRSFAASA